MSNRKVLIYLLLGFFLISLGSAGYFSYLLWLKPNTKFEVRPLVSSPGDSIIKFVSVEKNKLV